MSQPGKRVSLKALFLPVGLLVAVAFGLLYAKPGVALFSTDLAGLSSKTILILLIFLVTGYGMDRDRFRFKKKLFVTLVAVVLVNLIVAPLVGLAVLRSFHFASPLALGLAAFACVPTTLSSAIVITRTAGGNPFLAVTMVTFLNLVGVFTIPLTLGWLLTTGGIELDQWAMFQKIFLMVVVPMGIGIGIRRLFNGRPVWALRHVPATCIILIVWMAVSRSRPEILSIPGEMIWDLLAAVVLFHPILLLIAWSVAKGLPLERPDVTAFVFVGAEKTLPISVSVLALLVGANPELEMQLGMATVTCVILHFSQIMMDASIAAKLSK